MEQFLSSLTARLSGSDRDRLLAVHAPRTVAIPPEDSRRAVVVMPDGRIVGRGRNRREKGRSALAHAELEAIGEACRTLGGWRLWQCTLYVTLEPCCMCAGAITGAQIPRVVYGAKDPKMGAGGSLVNLLCLPGCFRPAVTTGVLEEECRALLQTFFRSLRERKKLLRESTRGEEFEL